MRRPARLVDGEPLVRQREQLAARVAPYVEPALRERVTEFLGEMVGVPFPDEERVQLCAARKDPQLMPRRACERMVRAALGEQASAEHVTEIVRRAAGNPFFVEELVRAADFTFRHGLVREAAYSMLTEVDRRLGHRLAGAWLEEAGERDARVLAEHFEHGGAIVAAARWYERAAEQALEASDLDVALARVERAFACAPGEGAAARPRTIVATAHSWRGTFVEAERAAKAAVALASEKGRTAHAALAMLAWASGALGKAEQLEEVASSLPSDMMGTALDRDFVLAWYSTTI